MPLKTQIDEQPGLNMTPMIDIVFLLIIFFMVGTKFTEMEKSLDIRLPEVVDHGALTDAPANKIVNVFEDGHIALGTQPVTLTELTEQLTAARQEYTDLGVSIRGDGRALHEQVIRAVSACRKAGISNFILPVRVAGRMSEKRNQ